MAGIVSSSARRSMRCSCPAMLFTGPAQRALQRSGTAGASATLGLSPARGAPDLAVPDGRSARLSLAPERHFGELPRWYRRRTAGSQRERCPRVTFGLSDTLASCPGGTGGGSRVRNTGGARGRLLVWATPWRAAPVVPAADRRLAPRAVAAGDFRSRRHFGELPRRYRCKSQDRNAGGARGRLSAYATLWRLPGGTGGGSQARNTGGTRGRLWGLRAAQARSYLLHGASCPEGTSATQAQRRPQEGGGK